MEQDFKVIYTGTVMASCPFCKKGFSKDFKQDADGDIDEDFARRWVGNILKEHLLSCPENPANCKLCAVAVFQMRGVHNGDDTSSDVIHDIQEAFDYYQNGIGSLYHYKENVGSEWDYGKKRFELMELFKVGEEHFRLKFNDFGECSCFKDFSPHDGFADIRFAYRNMEEYARGCENVVKMYRDRLARFARIIGSIKTRKFETAVKTKYGEAEVMRVVEKIENMKKSVEDKEGNA